MLRLASLAQRAINDLQIYVQVGQTGGSHVAMRSAQCARYPLPAVIVESKFKYLVIKDDVWSSNLPPRPNLRYLPPRASCYKLQR
jgi:hypothetical protein